MSALSQIAVAILCIVFFVYVIVLISRGRLLLRYSIMWMVLAAVIFICALFPGVVGFFTHLLGFSLSSNFVFMVGLFLLMFFNLSLSVIASRQATSIKNLTQRLAIVELEVSSLKDAAKDK